MNRRHSFAALVVAIPGAAACVVALALFVWSIVSNSLAWRDGQGAREYYLAVGEAYSHGFITGFFLCFFLLVVGLAVAAWFPARFGRHRATRAGVEPAAGSHGT